MRIDSTVTPGEVVLNKYRVERILGRGGMGIVMAARHIELDELFAIKIMLPGIAENDEAPERFLREARAAAKLKGDHVARVQDFGRLPDGTPYMVMEYLAGSDLKQLLRQEGRLSIEDAVTYVLQACETLREAHALGIVHRDIKPANIFLTRGPNGAPRVKVLDFGISKHTSADTEAITLTSSGGGSPLYMSPEQMRSAKYVDPRADIWSIGVVLYELLTGTSPFRAETLASVMLRVLNDDPAPPSRVRAGLPATLDAVVLRCLTKRREERLQTIDDLMAALLPHASRQRIAEDSSIEGPTIPLQRKGAPAVLERSIPDGALGGVSHSMSSTTGAINLVANVPETERLPQLNTSPSPRRRPVAVAGAAALVLCGAAGALVWTRSSGDSSTAIAAPSAAAPEASSSAAAAATSSPSEDVPSPEPPAAEPSASTTTTTAAAATSKPAVGSQGTVATAKAPPPPSPMKNQTQPESVTATSSDSGGGSSPRPTKPADSPSAKPAAQATGEPTSGTPSSKPLAPSAPAPAVITPPDIVLP